MYFISKHRKLCIELICFLLILLFVYAAGSKLMDYQKFRVQVGQSPVLTSIGGWITIAVPLAELAISVMLTFPRLRLPALYASFCLMVMFTTYIVIILTFSPFIPCSCGGILDEMGWTTHLFFNLGFVLLAMTGVLLFRTQKELDKPLFS